MRNKTASVSARPADRLRTFFEPKYRRERGSGMAAKMRKNPGCHAHVRAPIGARESCTEATDSVRLFAANIWFWAFHDVASRLIGDAEGDRR